MFRFYGRRVEMSYSLSSLRCTLPVQFVCIITRFTVECSMNSRWSLENLISNNELVLCDSGNITSSSSSLGPEVVVAEIGARRWFDNRLHDVAVTAQLFALTWPLYEMIAHYCVEDSDLLDVCYRVCRITYRFTRVTLLMWLNSCWKLQLYWLPAVIGSAVMFDGPNSLENWCVFRISMWSLFGGVFNWFSQV